MKTNVSFEREREGFYSRWKLYVFYIRFLGRPDILKELASFSTSKFSARKVLQNRSGHSTSLLSRSIGRDAVLPSWAWCADGSGTAAYRTGAARVRVSRDISVRSADKTIGVTVMRAQHTRRARSRARADIMV